MVGVPDHRMGRGTRRVPARRGRSHRRSSSCAPHVRSRLAAPKAPRYWVFLDEFPLTGSGKIQKFVLRERWDAGAFAVIDAVGDRPARS